MEDVSGSGGVDFLGGTVGVRDTWGVGGMQGIGGGGVTLGTGVIGGRWGIGLLRVRADGEQDSSQVSCRGGKTHLGWEKIKVEEIKSIHDI